MNPLALIRGIKLPVKLTRALGRAGLALRAHAPEILTGGGIVMVVGCVITSCRATLKLGDILEESKDRIDTVKAEPQEDAPKQLAVAYLDTGVRVAKLYLLPVALGVGGIGFIIGGNRVLRRENAAIAAAYVALSESFRGYRERVREDVGEEKEREYYCPTHKEKIFVVDDEGGGEEREITVVDTNTLSPYARFFDVGNPNFVLNRPEGNLMFLRRIQNIANDMLHANGHIFLNEVYDMLGIERSEAGQVVGWVDGAGDSFVDFGIYDITDLPVRNFVNGFEEAILLDFNVDGPITYILEQQRGYRRAMIKEA